MLTGARINPEDSPITVIYCELPVFSIDAK